MQARCATSSKRSRSYDLAIIGAGSAGFSAAITAAEQGARVALIGHGTIGGTCVNTGCVPSKNLIRAVESLHHAHAASRFAGIRAQGRVEDWAAVAAQKDELVAGLRQAKYADLLPEYDNIAYLEGEARLTDSSVVADGTRIEAPKVIIATGARPACPNIPGLDQVAYLTSTTALELSELPQSLIVIGGGYVGCELGQLFARAGVRVTIVSRRGLLPEGEPEIAQALTRYLGEEGITVLAGIVYKHIAEDGHGVVLSVTRDGRSQQLCAQTVLVAAGRSPNVEGLGLAEAGVGQLRNGAIAVDDRMRTTKPGVYAAGDVTGKDQFVYMAAYGARLAVENALNGDKRRYDPTAMPSVVFTDPQVAMVGLTEAAARNEGLQVRTSLLPLDYVPRALAARDMRGLIKLVADARTGRLLGAHILAPEGADSIQTAALAIRHRMTVQELGETIFPYLTTVEGLKLAAQAFARDVARLSCCAG
jgi:mercuric reductase